MGDSYYMREYTENIVNKKCDEIRLITNEWYKKLQRYGDKEAYVSSINELRKKIGDIRTDLKSSPEIGNSVLYAPDNARLLSIVKNNLNELTDDIVDYMKEVTKTDSFDIDERSKVKTLPDKIENLMDDFDRMIDNCFVTKRTTSISGFIVMTDDLLDMIEDIMDDGVIEDLIDKAEEYCNKYMRNIEMLTKFDVAMIESVFKLVRSFCGSMRLCVGKVYGNICTNTQRIQELLKE